MLSQPIDQPDPHDDISARKNDIDLDDEGSPPKFVDKEKGNEEDVDINNENKITEEILNVSRNLDDLVLGNNVTPENKETPELKFEEEKK